MRKKLERDDRESKVQVVSAEDLTKLGGDPPASESQPASKIKDRENKGTKATDSLRTTPINGDRMTRPQEPQNPEEEDEKSENRESIKTQETTHQEDSVTQLEQNNLSSNTPPILQTVSPQ